MSMSLIHLIYLICFSTVFCYSPPPTPWFCTDPNALNSVVEVSQTLPSCTPGYVIDIEDVVYESTSDGTCSGTRLCSLHHKNTLAFACNQKKSCQIDIRHFRFHINSTCGSTVRFFTKYRCLPVIYEQKDYLCGSPTARLPNLGDINLSCQEHYRLHISLALIGVSVKPQEVNRKIPWQCGKETYWLCNQYIADNYRNVCENQWSSNAGDQCRIRYADRPTLRSCEYRSNSNFSIVEYSCVPGEGLSEDLPRLDICSKDLPEEIPFARALIHSPSYPHPFGQYLNCKKQLRIPRESRLRMFMLEKSMEYYHQLNIRLLNSEPSIQRTLTKNEMFDTNFTQIKENEIVEIELKSNHLGGGAFLLYIQVDSRLSDYAPFALENDRKNIDARRGGDLIIKRDWGVVIGSLIGLLLVLLLVAIVFIGIRLTRKRRAKTLRYLQSDDDHREHLNSSKTPPSRPLQIEHPHLRPTTGLPQESRESLLKQATSMNWENSYEEILDEQRLMMNDLENSSEFNTYLEPKFGDERRKLVENPIRDHQENEARYRRSAAPLATPEQDKRRLGSALYDAPMASTETLDVLDSSKRPTQAPPRVPPPRMDLTHPKPSAPVLHQFENDSHRNHPRV